jgi:hypothetical protein
MNYLILQKLNIFLTYFLNYSEYNRLISGYINSLIKFKLLFFFIILYNTLNIIYITSKKKIKYIYQCYYNNMNNYLFGLSIKYKIIGRGFKGIKKNNNLIFKLGYPILCFFTFPITYCIWVKKKSKQKIYSFKHKRSYSRIFTIGCNTYNFYLLSYKIDQLKIPDIYCKKGLFFRGKKIFFKKGKKAFSL